ncbi:hypothetical protein CCMA1212_008758 [Trichoderma ghanense]|uniref:Uncharacterized protein n=1 Tax=Trichoderma ghanense TaxID=65468 RepID=A0ABY2GUE6_9HYPO
MSRVCRRRSNLKQLRHQTPARPLTIRCGAAVLQRVQFRLHSRPAPMTASRCERLPSVGADNARVPVPQRVDDDENAVRASHRPE